MTVRAARISHACAGRWGPLPARPREIRAGTCVNARPSRRSSRGTPRARGTRTRRSRSRGSRTTQRRGITARYARKETAASPKILPPRALAPVSRETRQRATAFSPDAGVRHHSRAKNKTFGLRNHASRFSARRRALTSYYRPPSRSRTLKPASSRARGICDGAHDAHDDDPQPR